MPKIGAKKLLGAINLPMIHCGGGLLTNVFIIFFLIVSQNYCTTCTGKKCQFPTWGYQEVHFPRLGLAWDWSGASLESSYEKPCLKSI
jgi:hypothetical protein